MYTASGTKVCTQTSMGNAVISVNPHRLIKMLFDGVNSTLMRARLFMQQGDIIARDETLSKAINTIDNGLKAGLDHEKGGELVINLSSLYDYMVHRLLHANLNNDCQAIEEVEGLLGNIADTRRRISPNTPSRKSR